MKITVHIIIEHNILENAWVLSYFSVSVGIIYKKVKKSGS